MNYFNKNKIAIWVIIILAVLNIAVITTIVYHIFSDEKIVRVVVDPPKRKNMGHFVRNELNLSNEQQLEFKKFREEYFHETEKIRKKLKDKRIEMLDELAMNKSNEEKLNNIAEEIGDLHTELKKETIIHFLKMKNVCNADQRKKLNLLFRDMMYCRGHFEGHKMRHHDHHKRYMKASRKYEDIN